MGEPFIGSKAVANGDVVKSALRTRYTRIFPDVYIAPNAQLTPVVRATAAWLWSGRRGVIAGMSASAVHGAIFVDKSSPIELIHTNRNPNAGLLVRSEPIAPDEIVYTAGIPITAVARTMLDIACWYPRETAVAALDDLARLTKFDVGDARRLAARCKGRRGVARAREVLLLVDPGAQSPKETWLRLLLIDEGLPRPETQIPVPIPFSDRHIYLDMGWEHLKIAVEYDGEQHRTKRSQFSWDVKRHEILQRSGWIVIRVLADDTPDDILRRVRAAFAARGVTLP